MSTIEQLKAKLSLFMNDRQVSIIEKDIENIIGCHLGEAIRDLFAANSKIAILEQRLQEAEQNLPVIPIENETWSLNDSDIVDTQDINIIVKKYAIEDPKKFVELGSW